MTLTFKVLANNQIRIKHTVGRRSDVSPKVDDFSTLRFSDSGKVVPLRPDPESELARARDSAAPSLTTLTNINTHEKSEKSLRKWGLRQRPKKFTKLARDTISEACCVLDRLYGRDNLRFVTLTLPGSKHESMSVLSRWSGWFINRLKQVFRNWSKYHPAAHECFVWELQKRGALHLHWVIGCDVDVEKLSIRLKDKWYELLKEVGDKEGIDMFARKGFGASHKDSPDTWQWKIEKIEKSIQRYLSKYTSKGLNENSDRTRSYSKFQKMYSPSQWWGISRNLLKEIQRYRVELRFETLSTEECNLMIDRLFELIPLDTISHYYYKEWSLDDIGISGVTMGAFIDADKFDTVCGIIAPFIWEWYGEVELSRRQEKSALMASRRAELWGDVRQNNAKFEALVMSSSRPILEMYGGAISV